jgi:hypothetical protein
VQGGLKLNGAHYRLVCADDSVSGGRVPTVKENAEASVVDRKEN